MKKRRKWPASEQNGINAQRKKNREKLHIELNWFRLAKGKNPVYIQFSEGIFLVVYFFT